ncbi:hypothetical protein [Nostoc sp.]
MPIPSQQAWLKLGNHGCDPLTKTQHLVFALTDSAKSHERSLENN